MAGMNMNGHNHLPPARRRKSSLSPPRRSFYAVTPTIILCAGIPPDSACGGERFIQHMRIYVVQHPVAKAVGLDQAPIDSLESKAREGVGSPGSTSETSRAAGSNKNSNKSDQQDRQAPPREQ